MFKVNIDEYQEGVYVVILEGRLDTEVHHLLRSKIENLLVPSTRVLIFDMSNLEYISSAGLAVIFQVKKAIEEGKGQFIMTGLQPQVKKIMDIVKDWPEDSIFKTMDEVDEYLNKIQKDEIEKRRNPSVE